jgi:hypothetical protein
MNIGAVFEWILTRMMGFQTHSQTTDEDALLALQAHASRLNTRGVGAAQPTLRFCEIRPDLCFTNTGACAHATDGDTEGCGDGYGDGVGNEGNGEGTRGVDKGNSVGEGTSSGFADGSTYGSSRQTLV